MAPKKVVIVGSGIFGMSTALWMLEEGKGKYDVTILEKCTVVPAPDAASTDINKIVRGGDYADPHLAALSIDAIECWKKPEWGGCYHESGVMCLSGADSAGRAFVSSSFANCTNMGLGPRSIQTPEEIKACLPSELRTGAFADRAGYMNTTGGWGEAARSVEIGLERVRKLGGVVRGGADVVALHHAQGKGRKVDGVVLRTGEVVLADLVVIAAGAWSPSLMASPSMSLRFPEVVATGQTVAMVQLTPEEMKVYGKCPVIFNLDTGFYLFPPTADGIIKLAIHAAGWTNSSAPTASGGKASIPRTKLTPGAEDGAIPVESARALRKHLAEIYPDLAKKPFVQTRLCWYCDTVSGDWLIDYHPDYENLFLATGGSGHAYKFAPNIGREVLAIIERRGRPEFTNRFSFAPTGDAGADVRFGTRKEIVVDELCKPADLLPVPGRAGGKL